MIKRLNLWIPLVFSVLFLGMLGWVYLNRLTYPYDLEWMEGGMLMHAVRLSLGKGYTYHQAQNLCLIFIPLAILTCSRYSHPPRTLAMPWDEVCQCLRVVHDGASFWCVRRESIGTMVSLGLACTRRYFGQMVPSTISLDLIHCLYFSFSPPWCSLAVEMI